MVTLANELHSLNAHCSMSVTESGIITLNKELQWKKAPSPICFVANFGIITLAKEMQCAKMQSPM